MKEKCSSDLYQQLHFKDFVKSFLISKLLTKVLKIQMTNSSGTLMHEWIHSYMPVAAPFKKHPDDIRSIFATFLCNFKKKEFNRNFDQKSFRNQVKICIHGSAHTTFFPLRACIHGNHFNPLRDIPEQLAAYSTQYIAAYSLDNARYPFCSLVDWGNME